MATKKSKPSKGTEEAKNTKEELGYDPDKGFGKVMFFFKKNPAALVVVLLVIAALLGLMFYNNHQKKAAEDAHLQEVIANEKEALKTQQQQSDITKGTDMQLVQNQESLVQAFGKTPKGYIRNWDGSLLSLGDNNMTSDQVLYSYLKGISTLDMATVQKYSRNSSVYKTYSGYFDQGTAVSTDKRLTWLQCKSTAVIVACTRPTAGISIKERPFRRITAKSSRRNFTAKPCSQCRRIKSSAPRYSPTTK